MAKKRVALDPVANLNLSTQALLWRSFNVMLTNLIPLYGVWHYGWNSFILILLFIVEGIIVFGMDVIKHLFQPVKAQKGILFFEFVFIFFFGFFAILIFGRSEDSSDLVQTIRTAFHSALALPLWPVLGIFLMRLLRTGQELFDAGVWGGMARQKLPFSGSGWMFLLFFLVMAAPFIADKSPNPAAGLIAVVVIKSLGEVFAVWVPRIAEQKSKK